MEVPVRLVSTGSTVPGWLVLGKPRTEVPGKQCVSAEGTREHYGGGGAAAIEKERTR